MEESPSSDRNNNTNTADGSDNSDSSESFIASFHKRIGSNILAQVPSHFLEDPFNLANLSKIIPHYKEAYDVLIDEYPSQIPQSIYDAAILLYVSIHFRFIRSPEGSDAVRKMFKKKEFGTCPCVGCHDFPLLPMALESHPGKSYARFYCARCSHVYEPRNSLYKGVDGAFFGVDYPQVFLLEFPELRPLIPTEKYPLKMYGFEVATPKEKRRVLSKVMEMTKKTEN